jgi:hypothetical protein
MSGDLVMKGNHEMTLTLAVESKFLAFNNSRFEEILTSTKV